MAEIVGYSDEVLDLVDVFPAAVTSNELFSRDGGTFCCGNHEVIFEFVVVKLKSPNMEDSTLIEDIILNPEISAVFNIHAEGFAVVEGTLLNVVCVLSDHVVDL